MVYPKLCILGCLACIVACAGAPPSPTPTKAVAKAEQCISVWSVQEWRVTRPETYEGVSLRELAADGNSMLLDDATFPGGLERGSTVWPSDSWAVGRVAPEAREQIGDVRLAWFLIHSHIIETYVHLRSVVCLVGLEERGGSTTLRFGGVHLSGNFGEQPLAFTVVIDASGTIRVVPKAPKRSLPLSMIPPKTWRQPLVPYAFRAPVAPPKKLTAERQQARKPPPAHFGAGPEPNPLPGLDLLWEQARRPQEVVVTTRRSVVVHGYNSLVVYRPDDGARLFTIVDRSAGVEPFGVPPPVYGNPSLFGLGDHYLVDSKEVIVFEERSATPKWRREKVCGVRPAIRQVQRVDDILYLLDSTPRRSMAIAVRLVDGACVWAADTVEYGYPLQLEASRDFVAVRSGDELWVHDPKNGNPRFRHEAEKSFGAAPTSRGVAIGIVGVGALVLDAKTGAVATRYDDPSLGYGNHEDIGYVGTLQVNDDVLYVDAGSDLYAWPIATQRERWRLRYATALPQQGLDGALYACSAGGYLSALDARTGREHWRWGACHLRGVAHDEQGQPLLIDHAGGRIAAFTPARRRPMETATVEGNVTVDGRPGVGLTVHIGRTSPHKPNDDSGAQVKTDARGHFKAQVVALGVVSVYVSYEEAQRMSGRPRVEGTTGAVALTGSGRYRVRLDARGADEEL